MSDLWPRLHEFFDTDDGSLPAISVEDITDDQVRGIYQWVRSQCDIYCDDGVTTLWDRVAECNVAITTLQDPAQLMLDGQVEPFRHGLTRFSISDIQVPHLTIAVSPHSIEFDYRMGSDWGPPQLEALFVFLWAIQQIAPNAGKSHVHEGSSECSSTFTKVWNKFARGKSAI